MLGYWGFKVLILDLGTGFGLGLKGWIAVQVEDAGAEVNEEMPKYPCRSIGALMGRIAFWCMSNHRKPKEKWW